MRGLPRGSRPGHRPRRPSAEQSRYRR